jgi:DNA-binding HxlR family transcriptional regulator
MSARPSGEPVGPPAGCRAREVLDRVGDKWSLYVVHILGDGTRRFSALQRAIDAVTPRPIRRVVHLLRSTAGSIRRRAAPRPVRVAQYARQPVGAATTRMGRTGHRSFFR